MWKRLCDVCFKDLNGDKMFCTVLKQASILYYQAVNNSYILDQKGPSEICVCEQCVKEKPLSVIVEIIKKHKRGVLPSGPEE